MSRRRNRQGATMSGKSKAMKKRKTAKTDFLISIRPRHVSGIMAGTKTVELRRRFVSSVDSNSRLLIYSTSPTRAVVGFARIKAVVRMKVTELWKRFGKAAQVLQREFEDYFSGLEEGFAIILGSVTTFKNPVEAKTLEAKFGFVPPQSFMYLRREYYPLLGNGRRKATD